MHPTAAAVASLTWPSKHDAKSEHYLKSWKPSIHAAFSPVDPPKSPTRFREEPEFEEELTLSGALAAALAVNEAFLFVRQDTPEAGLRDLGVSLWRPDSCEDWWRPEKDGPRLSYLPSKLWLIGLGHLGQAYLWGLSILPYARPEDL